MRDNSKAQRDTELDRNGSASESLGRRRSDCSINVGSSGLISYVVHAECATISAQTCSRSFCSNDINSRAVLSSFGMKRIVSATFRLCQHKLCPPHSTQQNEKDDKVEEWLEDDMILRTASPSFVGVSLCSPCCSFSSVSFYKCLWPYETNRVYGRQLLSAALMEAVGPPR